MALPQPSQPARTLPGQLALGLALVINSLGVVLMLRSGGGISAISSLPYALSLALPALSLGTWTYLFQGALVAGLMVLRRRFVPAYLFSFVVGFLFGKLLDLQAGWLSPLPEGLPDTQDFLPLLPQGLRAFALYIQAHYLYLKGEYGPSAGLVEGALSMGAAAYPIPALYLHLVAVMDYMSLKQTQKARAHLLAAWALAQPDDLIEGFGEHHGLLGAMLEAAIKPNWPEDFKRIIDITYRFSSGWRRVHNPITGHDVADDLTTTEFAVCMLAARGWTTREIAGHLNISANTAKRHISEAMKKLKVKNRKDLKQYMLR